MRRETVLAAFGLGCIVLIACSLAVSFSDVNATIGEPSQAEAKGGVGISTSDWNTYRNEKYGFELKYPKNWSVRSDTHPVGGQRWVEEVILKNRPISENEITRNQYKDMYVKVYRAYPEDRDKGIVTNNIMTDEYHFGMGANDLCVTSNATTTKLNGISPVEITVRDSDRSCLAAGAYFFSEEHNNYIYNIIPVPLGGIDYVGYDGKKMVAETFPEFYEILSTFTVHQVENHERDEGK